MEDKTGRNTNSAGESHDRSPDPIARNDSGRPQEETQPAEIVPAARIPISVADATLLSNQSIGTAAGMRAVPSVGEIIESMLRFKWTILIVFLVVAVPAITAIWTLVAPKYRAQAQLRVRPIIPYLVFRTEESGSIPLYDSFVNTQASIIRSSAVLQRVLDVQEVSDTQWYKKPGKSIVQRLYGTPNAPLERLRDDLSAKPRAETEIIDVSFTSYSAKEAQLIVDTVLDHYIKYIEEKSDATGDKIYSQLVEQYKTLENEILGREKIIAELRRTLGTGTPEELISGKRVRLDETQARFSQVRQEAALLEWEMKQAITNDGNDVPAAATDEIQNQPKYHEDVEWRRLDANVRAIQHNISMSLFTPKHPEATRMEKELEFAKEQLKLREAQLDEQWRDRPENTNPVRASITIAGASGLSYEEGLKYIEHQLARSKREEQILDDELKKQQAEFAGLFESAQLLDKETNALLHKRELFSAVRQRLDQKNMERNVPGSIEVLTRAQASPRAYSDRRVPLTVLVLFLGLGLGGGVAYLRAGRNQAIYTPNDMPYPMQAPFLGYIPVTQIAGSLEKGTSPATVESIRIVRTTLLSRLNGQAGNTVLVTSAAEGTGKSTFTTMLGRSLARSGKKVLLIDADFQKITLTKRFGLCDKWGFIQALHRRNVYKQFVFPTDTPGLNIMPVGKQGEDEVEFEEIANGAFKICIGILRKHFNIILVDSSPILPVADATILSNQVDGTIMVERELVSRRADVLNALARLSSADGRFLGTVFIGSDSNGKYG